MLVEIRKSVSSVAEAIVVARQAKRDGGIIPIEPCVKVNPDGQAVICPRLDSKLEQLCKDPDGIGRAPNGLLDCPLQKGPIYYRVLDK